VTIRLELEFDIKGKLNNLENWTAGLSLTCVVVHKKTSHHFQFDPFVTMTVFLSISISLTG